MQSADELLRTHLPLVEEIVRIVCRRRGLTVDEAEEFASTVRLKLVENDCRILRSFRGEASLRTYLTTVVQRLAQDFLIARSGKWRPSAKARRLGQAAVVLEELLVRQRLPIEEACETVARSLPGPISRPEVEALARELPVRHRPRTIALGPATVDGLADPDTPFTVYRKRRERSEQAAEIQEVLRRAIGALVPDDRLLLKLRFESGLPVPRIAPLVGQPEKRIYKRIERLLRGLRRSFDESGAVPGKLERLDQIAGQIDLWLGMGEESGSCPSNPARPERQDLPAGYGKPEEEPT